MAIPESVRISKDFRAPRESVWRAWTHPSALVRWLGPSHCPAVKVDADVREGGAWRACLTAGGDRAVLWQSGRYLVVKPPERLEFTFAWEGSNHEDGPGVETHVVVELEELAEGGTRMHFVQTGLVSAKSAAGHSEGWNSTFGRLAAFLSEER
ncbi:MAG: SRPBCC domain-containing protein [Proteobacteria bacterium]|nr:MAG: SRPBCC domain-containing protein [Pseudomonadota bacterium]